MKIEGSTARINGFRKYYDILPNTEVPADNVDAKINCMRVKC